MKIKSILKKFSIFNSQFSIRKGFTTFSPHERGFTLIELLIVIAILGVLAAGILVAIDPIDKINAANDSKVQNDVSGMGRAAEAYATVHNGFYPAYLSNPLYPQYALDTSGELKRVPVAPSGYTTYKLTASDEKNIPDSCDSAAACTRVIIGGNLKSKKYTSVNTTPFWNYDSKTGKSCVAASIQTGCP